MGWDGGESNDGCMEMRGYEFEFESITCGGAKACFETTRFDQRMAISTASVVHAGPGCSTEKERGMKKESRVKPCHSKVKEKRTQL